ncbi:MAG TPA: hypothetical protein VE684_10300 [Crenalkalicoccus sp.]|jgi:hypothetical protein|nr:hypothetical protein [Crenalkalicoccus sp.]
MLRGLALSLALAGATMLGVSGWRQIEQREVRHITGIAAAKPGLYELGGPPLLEGLAAPVGTSASAGGQSAAPAGN